MITHEESRPGGNATRTAHKSNATDYQQNTPHIRRSRVPGDGRVTQQDNRAAAIAWREAGFATIPLIPRSKSPAIRRAHLHGTGERGRCRGECGQLGHGFYDATTDVVWADQYWREHPDHGIGVRPDPGEIVLDIDPRHGGDTALEALTARCGKLPQTLTTISGRGDGRHHLWFDGVEGSVRQKLVHGIDILCHDRNFVVVPPSQHWLTEQQYAFEQPVADIAQAPDWLQEMATRSAPTTRAARRRQLRPPPSVLRRRCRGLIRAVTEAAEGERHRLLFWAAARASSDGLTDPEDRFYAELADAAASAGLHDEEINRVIADGIVAGREDGR